jgi:hypothetical protein
LANITDDGKGIEVAGLYNDAQIFNGLQLAGIMNHANRAKGLQLSLVANLSKNSTGSQIGGLFNLASKVKGIQIAGLFNAADSSDYPVGIVNIIKNGKKTLSFSTDELLFTHLDFRSGGRVLYGVIGFSYQASGELAKYGLQAGIGAHLINGQRFVMDTEYTFLKGIGPNSKSLQVNTLSLLPGLKISRRLQLFAGPRINQTSFNNKYDLKIPGWEINRRTYDDGTYLIQLGVTGGLQLVL